MHISHMADKLKQLWTPNDKQRACWDQLNTALNHIQISNILVCIDDWDHTYITISSLTNKADKCPICETPICEISMSGEVCIGNETGTYSATISQKFMDWCLSPVHVSVDFVTMIIGRSDIHNKGTLCKFMNVEALSIFATKK
jgi:hypothetical protein